MATSEFLQRMQKTMVADGQLLEAGFLQFRLDQGLEGAPAEQLVVLRRAFLSGARQAHTLTLALEESLPALKLRQELGRFAIEEARRREGEAAQEKMATPDVTGHA